MLLYSRGQYRSYTVKFKLEVVKYASNNSKAEASRKYGVHRKLVQTWCRQESDLSTIPLSRRRIPGSGLKARYAEKAKGYGTNVQPRDGNPWIPCVLLRVEREFR